MKKRLTRGEKLLFLSPLLFLSIVGLVWLRQNRAPRSIELPISIEPTMLQFSPDGKRIAVFFRNQFNTPNGYKNQNLAHIYDGELGAKSLDLEIPSPNDGSREYNWPFWSEDGHSLVAGSIQSTNAGRVRKMAIWDANSGRLKADHFAPKIKVRKAEYDFFGERVRFAPDGKTLIGQGIPPAIYSAETGQLLNKPGSERIWELNKPLGLVALRNPMTKRLQVIDWKTNQMVWDSTLQPTKFFWKGEVLFAFYPHEVVTLDASKNKAISQSRLWLWNGKTRKQLPTPPTSSMIPSLGYAPNPDGRTIAYLNLRWPSDYNTRPDSSEIVLWDYRANREIWRYQTKHWLYRLRWSPDGHWLGASGYGPFSLFNKNGELLEERQPYFSEYVWSSDSKQMAGVVGENDNAGNAITRHLQIHRLRD